MARDRGGLFSSRASRLRWLAAATVFAGCSSQYGTTGAPDAGGGGGTDGGVPKLPADAAPDSAEPEDAGDAGARGDAGPCTDEPFTVVEPVGTANLGGAFSPDGMTAAVSYVDAGKTIVAVGPYGDGGPNMLAQIPRMPTGVCGTYGGPPTFSADGLTLWYAASEELTYGNSICEAKRGSTALAFPGASSAQGVNMGIWTLAGGLTADTFVAIMAPRSTPLTYDESRRDVYELAANGTTRRLFTDGDRKSGLALSANQLMLLYAVLPAGGNLNGVMHLAMRASVVDRFTKQGAVMGPSAPLEGVPTWSSPDFCTILFHRNTNAFLARRAPR